MKADVYSFGVLILEIISGKSSARTNWGGTHKFLLEWVSFCFLLLYELLHKYTVCSIKHISTVTL